MARDSDDDFEVGHWDHDPPYSSLARTHASLRMSPSVHSLRQLSSPRSMHKLGSGPAIDIADHHIVPEWQYLELNTIRPSASSSSQKRATSIPDVAGKELQETCRMIKEACNLRHKWLYKPRRGGHLGSASKPHNVDIVKSKIPSKLSFSFRIEDGIATVFRLDHNDQHSEQKEQRMDCDDALYGGHSFKEFRADLQTIYDLMAHGPAKTLCYTRSKVEGIF